MRRFALLVAAVAAAGFVVAPTVRGHPSSKSLGPLQALCSSGYVDAIVGGAHKCLRAGEFCSPGNELDYERYGFACVDGHLKAGARAPTTTTKKTTTLRRRHPPPGLSWQDGSARREQKRPAACSGQTLTVAAPRAPTTRSSPRLSSALRVPNRPIRNVPVSEKHADEVEYGLVAASYGTTLEIDHIVSLELGGSNDIANLFPEKADAHPGYHVKDKLENKLHSLVCSGSMTLHAAQAGIAANWQSLYKRVYGVSPIG